MESEYFQVTRNGYKWIWLLYWERYSKRIN